MIRLFLFTTTVFVAQNLNAQHNINCDSIYDYNTKLQSNAFIFYESIPEIVGGYKKFYSGVEEKTRDAIQSGKVFVQFIVDTLGRVQCGRVAKSDNEKLNDQAVKLIEEARFTPAKQSGKKVIFVMVLPVVFGETKPPSEKRKR